MGKLICLQAGHYGRTTGVIGTAGEQELNWRITLALSSLLQSKGFVIQIVGADPPDSQIKTDFDLFLALHGDMDTPTNGGCIASGDKSVDDSWETSATIKNTIESTYFAESGIADRPNKVTLNMTEYYMWSRLTPKTPCVILEMGEVKDPHDSVILADTNRVAVAIAKGICKAFNVDYEPIPVPTPTLPPQADPCADIKKQLNEAKNALYTAQKSYSESLAAKDAECQQKITGLKNSIVNYIGTL